MIKFQEFYAGEEIKKGSLLYQKNDGKVYAVKLICQLCNKEKYLGKFPAMCEKTGDPCIFKAVSK